MFRTEVKVARSPLGLTLQDGIVTIGSCFAEVIGNKLKENKAPVLVNPFGTIFNPISVASLLNATSGKNHSLGQSLVQRDGIWYNYNLHSSISSPSKEKLLELIEQHLASTTSQLSKAKLLIMTLGTAIGYELAATGEVVANCHKLPSSQFNKFLLSPENIVQALDETVGNLKACNPELEIILTVSPVRHIKETLQLNSVSKATLRLACHNLVERHTHLHYFPAFEIMVDDLRDYRFYGEDMLHPTPVAENYIWEKFMDAFYQASFKEFTQQWAKIKRAISHKAFHPEAAAHQTFLRNTLQQLNQLAAIHQLDVEEEKNMLLRQIHQS